MRSGTAIDADVILTTTENVLRRHGPAKATVLDVARALGVSHSTIYRHFPSKGALREAVTRRWLDRAHDGLAAIATDTRLPASERLSSWLSALLTSTRATTSDDPELFATYQVLIAENWNAVDDHVADLIEQLRVIIADGVRSDEFAPTDTAVTARAVFHATMCFHHPAHSSEWQTPATDSALADVCALLIRGLRAH
jgi:AcrR family transcriptional regulator